MIMGNKEKTCMVRGRIITDPKKIKRDYVQNIKKQGNNIIGIGAIAGIGIGLKKYGPKVAKALIKVIKK
jgi:hypothetical protein